MKHAISRLLKTTLLLLMLPQTASAHTWFVPDAIPTIQAAIDSAASGDTVAVGPGSYAGGLVVKDKSLTLRGAGSDVTEIVPSGNTSLLLIWSTGAVMTCRVEAMRMKDARSIFGGGAIRSLGPIALELRGLDVVNCHSSPGSIDYSLAGRGGGVYVTGGASSLLMEMCRFSKNAAASSLNGIDASGGAVQAVALSIEIRRCVFEQNVAGTGYRGFGSSGGALSLEANTIHMEESEFSSNSAAFGAALQSSGSLTLTNCKYFGNAVPLGGPRCLTCGGSTVDHSGSAVIESCLFLGNSWNGNDYPVGPMSGCLNLTGSSNSLTIRSCTFAWNAGGPAIWLQSVPSSLDLSANLIAMNLGGGCRHGLTDLDGVRCNFVWGNTPDFPAGIDFRGQNDNQASDPLFCSGAGQVASGEVPMVTANSPCIPGQPGHPPACGAIGHVEAACPAVVTQFTTWSAIKTLYR
jgi:hypothetical protein